MRPKLFFQFYSHNHLFLDTVQVTSSSRSWKTNSLPVTRTLSLPQPPAPSLPISRTLSLPQPAVSTNICDRVEFNACKETHVIPLKMNTPSAVALLLLATLLAYFTSEYLLESLNGITASVRSPSIFAWAPYQLNRHDPVSSTHLYLANSSR
jgi:Ca2+:H+ antiporter